jgi:hypothetical protein
MAANDELGELEERVLLGLWKLKGIGKNHIKEEILKADLSLGNSANNWSQRISSLHDLGFLQVIGANGEKEISLTPLGISLIRQTEEDKLQELK